MVVLGKGLAWPGGVFFEGAVTAGSDLVPALWPVAIAGRPYNIEPKLCRRSFTSVQRPAQDQDKEPGEGSLSPEGMWRRSQSDWSLGAGQTWLDEIEESTRRRFDTSLGVEVFGDRQFSLLPSTQEKRNSANTNMKMLRAGGRMYVMDGANLVFGNASSSEQEATWPTTTTGTWTAATGLPGGNLLDMAFSGSHIYVLASDNSIYRATIGTASFAGPYYNPTAVMTRIYAGLGRLFASETNKLYEITATPGETLIFTHPDPNYTFSSLCAAPTGIYFTGNIGTDQGEVRHTWIRDDGTAFVAPVVVAEFPSEVVNVCKAQSNVMLIGTVSGFRMALIDGISTGLNFGAVTLVGDVRDITYDTIDSETFAWFTWTNIISGTSGLGRIRPARTPEPLVPAYASDIYTTTGATITNVVSLRGRRYFAATTDGFFGATANKVPSGTISTGRIRYGLLSPKLFISMQWRTAPLNGAVSATAVLDDGDTLIITNQGTEGSLGVGPVRLPDNVGEWINITFTLERDGSDATLGPIFRWWVLRSLPAPDVTQRHLIALRLEQKTQPPNGAVRQVDVASETDFIANLIAQRRVVKYQRGRNAYDVYVVNMEERPEQWAKMDLDMEGIVMVEMQTVN